MGSLLYRGRPPDSDFTMVPKSYADARYTALKVDSTFVASATAAEMLSRVTPSYVDTADGFLAHKTAVDAADAGYLALTSLGVANGVAQLGSDLYIPGAQLPTVLTERVTYFKNADTLFLTGSATQEVTTVNPREFQVGTLTIPDLGFTYTPLFFAVIRGGSTNAPAVTRAMGTGNYAQISVFRSDNTRYAFTITGGQKTYDSFTCLPSADVTTPLNGANTFGLYVGMQSGSTYTFSAVGLQFYCLAFPGL